MHFNSLKTTMAMTKAMTNFQDYFKYITGKMLNEANMTEIVREATQLLVNHEIINFEFERIQIELRQLNYTNMLQQREIAELKKELELRTWEE